MTQRLDESLGTAHLHHGLYHLSIIDALVCVGAVGVHQLFNQSGITRVNRLAHLAARILGRNLARDNHQMVDRDGAPVGVVLLGLARTRHLRGRIVDQRGQRRTVFFHHRRAEQCIDLLPNHTRTRSQQMDECLMFAVQIGKIILRPLGQVHNGAQVDQLVGDRFNRREFLGQQAQIVHVMRQNNLPLLFSNSKSVLKPEPRP